MLLQHRRGIAAANVACGSKWRENTLNAMQAVTLDGQVAFGSKFDAVLFIQSIQGRLARREFKAN